MECSYQPDLFLVELVFALLVGGRYLSRRPAMTIMQKANVGLFFVWVMIELYLFNNVIKAEKQLK